MPPGAPPIAAYCAGFRARYEPRCGFALCVGDVGVQVRSNSQPVIDALERYYAFFASSPVKTSLRVDVLDGTAPEPPGPWDLQPPSPGKSRIKEGFLDVPGGRLATRVGTELMFAFGGGDNVVVGPCASQLHRVVDFINAAYCRHRVGEGARLFHAAAVVHERRGLLLAGAPGSGKSTLALLLVQRGAAFVTNDRALVRDDGTVHGVPKAPRANPGTLLSVPALAPLLAADERARYASMPRDELWRVEDKHDVDIADCFGEGRQRERCVARDLVILRWTPTREPVRMTRIDLRRRDDLWPTFTKRLGLFCDPDLSRHTFVEDIDRYLACLSDVRVFELTGGVDFDAAVEAVSQL